MKQLWIAVVLVLLAAFAMTAHAGPVLATATDNASVRGAPVVFVGTYSSTKAVVHSGIGTMIPTEVAVAPVPVSRSGTQVAVAYTWNNTAANKGSPVVAMTTTALSGNRQIRGGPNQATMTDFDHVLANLFRDVTYLRVEPTARTTATMTVVSSGAKAHQVVVHGSVIINSADDNEQLGLHQNLSSLDGRTCAATIRSPGTSPVVASMTHGAEGKMDEMSASA